MFYLFILSHHEVLKIFLMLWLSLDVAHETANVLSVKALESQV